MAFFIVVIIGNLRDVPLSTLTIASLLLLTFCNLSSICFDCGGATILIFLPVLSFLMHFSFFFLSCLILDFFDLVFFFDLRVGLALWGPTGFLYGFFRLLVVGLLH